LNNRIEICFGTQHGPHHSNSRNNGCRRCDYIQEIVQPRHEVRSNFQNDGDEENPKCNPPIKQVQLSSWFNNSNIDAPTQQHGREEDPKSTSSGKTEA